MILVLDCEYKRAPVKDDFDFGQNLIDWFCLYKILGLDMRLVNSRKNHDRFDLLYFGRDLYCQVLF